MNFGYITFSSTSDTSSILDKRTSKDLHKMSSTAHGLSVKQVVALQDAVKRLDAVLVQSMREKRGKVWEKLPESKNLTDCRVRDMLVSLDKIDKYISDLY